MVVNSLRIKLITSFLVKVLKEKWSSLNFSLISLLVSPNLAKVLGSLCQVKVYNNTGKIFIENGWFM